MKTAMQQLIEYLDPIHSAIKDKAIELLEIENKQMEEIFKAGQDSMEEGGKNFEQYYNDTYEKM